MTVELHEHVAPPSAGPPVPVKLRVVHSVHCWLPSYGDWLYNQVARASDQTEPYVVCDTLENIGPFPCTWAYAASARPVSFLVDRGLRRAGLRRHRSLLAKVVESERPLIVHSHFAQTGWANVRFARRVGVRHVVSCYGEDMTKVPGSPRWRRRYQEMFPLIDAILCEGPHMASTVAALGCPPERIKMHPIGVSLDRIPFRPRKPGSSLRILMAAAFREKKGLSYAVHALGELAQRRVPFRATLVGDSRPGDDQTEKRAIFAALDHHALRGQVALRGFVSHDELLALAYEHDVFLSPSVVAGDGDAEGGAPIGLIEMAASGMPIMSTRHCDIPFVLAEPNRKLLVAERDPRALADAVESLLADDWGPLVGANRARIEAQHDARNQGLELVRLYREIQSW